MKSIFSLFTILFFTSSINAATEKYAVYFTDKDNVAFNIFEPQQYLTKEAINRRLDYGILIDDTDLPIIESYISQLKTSGAIVFGFSKWMNLAIIEIDPSLLPTIQSFNFVSKIVYVGESFDVSPDFKQFRRPIYPEYEKKDGPYGYGYSQISIMNGEYLHNLGYKGGNRHIAVLDGGFINVPIMPFFDSLRARGGLKYIKDVTENDEWPYENSTHGTEVLSCMASNLPGLFIGTAPDADYSLIMTEYVDSEYLIEEYNWVIGAEKADSVGAYLINSSLGYTDFDDKSTSHRYEDLNGDIAISTIGADMAAYKGILVVNSAGNSGSDRWKYIGAPSDADSVLAAGGISHSGTRASFSSFGPSSDLRIKPNLSAVGKSTVVASIDAPEVTVSDGTSFSSPVLCGITASLWSAFPEKRNMQIIDAMQQTASQADNPDYSLGYGVPNMIAAYLKLSESKIPSLIEHDEFVAMPVFTDDKAELLIFGVLNGAKVQASIVSMNETTSIHQTITTLSEVFTPLQFEDYSSLSPGVYYLELETNDALYRIPFVKGF